MERGALLLFLVVREVGRGAGELEVEFDRITGVTRVGRRRKERKGKEKTEESSTGETWRGRRCSWLFRIGGGGRTKRRQGSGQLFYKEGRLRGTKRIHKKKGWMHFEQKGWRGKRNGDEDKPGTTLRMRNEERGGR